MWLREPLTTWFERDAYPLARVVWQRVGADEPLQILDSRVREPDLGHVLQLVEGDGLPRCGLLDPELRPLVGPVDPVEEYGDGVGVGVRCFDRATQ